MLSEMKNKMAKWQNGKMAKLNKKRLKNICHK